MNFDEWWRKQDERFRHAMLKPDMRDVWEAATKAERKSCADICEKFSIGPMDRVQWDTAISCRDNILARSNA